MKWQSYIAFLLVATAGAAIALLVAPQSGDEMRRSIMHRIKEGERKTREQMAKLSSDSN